jgi:hypothetical protein
MRKEGIVDRIKPMIGDSHLPFEGIIERGFSNHNERIFGAIDGRFSGIIVSPAFCEICA